MKVLVLGGEGMLGHKVFQVLGERFHVRATFRTESGNWQRYPMYQECGDRCIGGVDATDFTVVANTIEQVKPDAIVNCIGIISHVEEASNTMLSMRLNAMFPHRLARLCEQLGCRMIHMSTDCVFTGRKGMYREDDISDVDDVYGMTKLLGEVRDSANALTIRTSIFGRDYMKNNVFLEWFLSRRPEVGGPGKAGGFVDAIFSGFPTMHLAWIIGALLTDHPELSGLYQVSAAPISKHDLLVKIRDSFGLDIEIEPKSAPRPVDKSLDSSRFRNETGITIPTWDEMIADLANDDTPYDGSPYEDWRNPSGSA